MKIFSRKQLYMNSSVAWLPCPSTISRRLSEGSFGSVSSRKIFSSHSRAISLLVQPFSEFVKAHGSPKSRANYGSWMVADLKITRGVNAFPVAEMHSTIEVQVRFWLPFT